MKLFLLRLIFLKDSSLFLIHNKHLVINQEIQEYFRQDYLQLLMMGPLMYQQLSVLLELHTIINFHQLSEILL